MSSGVEARFSFPKGARIAKRADFKKVYELGRKQFGKHVVIFFLPNGTGQSRLGITVTRKVGKSHDRNLLKRRVREVYRLNRIALAIDPRGLDLVVNLKNSARNATHEEFSDDLVRTLQRVIATPRNPA